LDGHGRNARGNLEFHHLFGQQPHRPARIALGSRRTGQGGQAGRESPIKDNLARGLEPGLAFERGIYANFSNPTLEMFDGASGDAKGRARNFL
jgi:hypothetical protein